MTYCKFCRKTLKNKKIYCNAFCKRKFKERDKPRTPEQELIAKFEMFEISEKYCREYGLLDEYNNDVFSEATEIDIDTTFLLIINK